MGLSEWVLAQISKNGDNKSGIHRDFTVNRQIAENTLDKMSEAFRSLGLQMRLTDILMAAIVLDREADIIVKANSNCGEMEGSTKDRRGIIRFNELGERNLSYLFAMAIKEIGIDNIADFGKVTALWESWADNGLKIMYCNYFTEYFASSPSQFFEMLVNKK